MWQSLLFGLLGTGAMVGGLILSVPLPPSMMAAAADQTETAAEGVDGADDHGNGAESRDLPVLVAPLISPDGEIVGYQSLALSVVLTENYDAKSLKPLQFAIEDSFNEWISTSSDDDRRAQFDDLFTLADYLEKKAGERFDIGIEFDLVALQSDVFAAAETRQNLIEPKGGSTKAGSKDPSHR